MGAARFQRDRGFGFQPNVKRSHTFKVSLAEQRHRYQPTICEEPVIVSGGVIAPKGWSGRRDSNSRHLPWQGSALPTELRPLSAKRDANHASEIQGIKYFLGKKE
jgi:hypothetical protein